MPITAKLDEWGRPAWIAAFVLGFIIYWPVGLLILGYTIWSGRMGCGQRAGFARWGDKRGWHRSGPWTSGFGTSGFGNSGSGNTAFDEYRTETLKRLEDEEEEFRNFLGRLRQAKDKTEFDQFMAERRNRPAPPPPQPEAGEQG
jgi:hypothetical protein